MSKHAGPIRQRPQAYLAPAVGKVRIRNRKPAMRAQFRRAVNALDTSRALHHRRMKFDTNRPKLRQNKISGKPNKMR
jgi:hypothetical protein